MSLASNVHAIANRNFSSLHQCSAKIAPFVRFSCVDIYSLIILVECVFVFVICLIFNIWTCAQRFGCVVVLLRSSSTEPNASLYIYQMTVLNRPNKRSDDEWYEYKTRFETRVNNQMNWKLLADYIVAYILSCSRINMWIWPTGTRTRRTRYQARNTWKCFCSE